MVFRKKKGHNLLNFKRRAPAAAAAAAGGGGVQQEQHQQQLPHETSIFRRESERDFYQNPTILSRLILHQKYPAAIRRLKKVPTEAAIWVSSTRGGTNNYHSRRNADETAGRAAATAATAAADADVASTTVPIHSSRPTAISPSMDQFNRAISASTMISALTDSFDSEAAAPKDIIWNGPATECTPDEKVSRDHSSSLSSSSPDQSSQLHCNNNNNNNNNNKPYAFRQLPLHMACSNLRLLLTNEKTAKQQLEQLISQLVVTFPQACARRDHEYRLPLHEALWNNASPDVIVLLLIAYPEAVDEPDIYGRTAAELNEYRRGASPVDKQAVSRMLQRNASFWKFAKQEADLRLKHNKNNVLDNVNASVNSTSVLNDSLATEGDYTLATKESAFQGRAAAGNEPEPPTRTETSWSQLEKRVLNLERALAESYEQNYGMAQEISRLEDIQKKYYKVISKQFLAKQVIQLEEDNAELRMQLGLMETILKRNNLTMEDASVFSGPTSIEVDDDDDDDAGPQAAAQMQNQQQQRQQDEVVQLRDDNQILRAQVASLTSRMEEFQRMLEDYERDANKRKEEETSETQRSTTEEDDMEEEESLAMSLSTTTVHSHLSNMNVDEKALVPMPPTVSPLQRGITHNLDGLLELAETTYGHKFSPELVEAWRNITVDGDNFSLFSGVGGMSVLDKLSEVDIEDEIDDLSLPSPSEVKSNKGQKQSGEEAHEQKGNLSQPSSTDRKSGGDTRQPIQKTYEQTEDMSMYSVLWA